jgi:hypothetical protein
LPERRERGQRSLHAVAGISLSPTPPGQTAASRGDLRPASGAGGKRIPPRNRPGGRRSHARSTCPAHGVVWHDWRTETSW